MYGVSVNTAGVGFSSRGLYSVAFRRVPSRKGILMPQERLISSRSPSFDSFPASTFVMG